MFRNGQEDIEHVVENRANGQVGAKAISSVVASRRLLKCVARMGVKTINPTRKNGNSTRLNGNEIDVLLTPERLADENFIDTVMLKSRGGFLFSSRSFPIGGRLSRHRRIPDAANIAATVNRVMGELGSGLTVMRGGLGLRA